MWPRHFAVATRTMMFENEERGDWTMLLVTSQSLNVHLSPKAPTFSRPQEIILILGTGEKQINARKFIELCLILTQWMMERLPL